MFRLYIAALIVAQFALMPTMAQAQSLEPDGPWRVDYAYSECRLTRGFGTGESAVDLRIARGASLDDFDIIIAGNKLPLGTAARGVMLTATPANITADATAKPYYVKGKKLRIWRWFDIDNRFLGGLNDEQSLYFVGRGMDVRLRTPGLKKALTALQTCHDDLLANVFKLDVATLRSLTKYPTPIGKPERWILSNDYPNAALSAGQGGGIQLSLQVDQNGQPLACNIVVSSGTPVLDKAACDALMARAKFEPAEDKDGKPIAGLWLRTVRWIP